MGTIYKETVNRGRRGGINRYEERWTAEIVIDGKRHRRRAVHFEDAEKWLIEKEKEQRHRKKSAGVGRPITKNRSDAAIRAYRNNLMRRWCNGELVKVDGAPSYLIDRKTLRCYSMITACQLKNVGTKKAPAYHVNCSSGERICVNACRVLWAHDQQVPLSDISSDYAFSMGDDGQIVVSTRTDAVNAAIAKKKAMNRIEFLDRSICEIKLLRDSYVTGNTDDVMQYAMRHREDICRIFISRTHVCRDVADDVFIQAALRMEDRIKSPDRLLANITYNLVGIMRQVYEERQKEREYNDNIRRDDV